MLELDMTPTERIGRTTWLLAQGRQVTVRALASELEITPRGARALLERLSRVVPLVDDGGLWRVAREDDSETGE
jgi:predicted DNA-binding transcriptional regulator YafY